MDDLNPLNAKLNPICHLLALLGAHHILYFSWLRVKLYAETQEKSRASTDTVKIFSDIFKMPFIMT